MLRATDRRRAYSGRGSGGRSSRGDRRSRQVGPNPVTGTTAVARLVRRREVDLGGDPPSRGRRRGRRRSGAPASGPAPLVDHAAAPGRGRRASGADLVVLGEVAVDRLRPALGVPAGVGVELAEVVQRRSAASSTRRNIALRTSTRNARALRGDRGGGSRGDGAAGLGARSVRVGQLLPLVEQAGVDLADQLAEPLDEVVAAPRSWPRPARSGAAPCTRRQVAQHQPLGPRELVVARRTRRRSSPARTCRARPTSGDSS